MVKDKEEEEGNWYTQIDYILCRRGNLREIRDCKVVAGESVAKQHRMVVCKIMMKMRKMKSVRTEQKIKWWKLRKEECCEEFRREVRAVLGHVEEFPDDWDTTATGYTERW